MDGGRAWRQGNWLTALLWVVSLAVHLGYDYLVDGRGSQAGLGSASLLLYFGVTFTIRGSSSRRAPSGSPALRT